MPDKKLLDHSEGVVEIKFCPWCGCNLRERYAPEQVLRGTFHGSDVTLWWMQPNATFSVGFLMPDIRGKRVQYSTREDGRLDKSVSFHLGREGSVDPDEVLRYDPGGNLTEKVDYHYQWDSFKNWTTREMKVWDSTKGAEVLVERAIRTIQYY